MCPLEEIEAQGGYITCLRLYSPRLDLELNPRFVGLQSLSSLITILEAAWQGSLGCALLNSRGSHSHFCLCENILWSVARQHWAAALGNPESLQPSPLFCFFSMYREHTFGQVRTRFFFTSEAQHFGNLMLCVGNSQAGHSQQEIRAHRPLHISTHTNIITFCKLMKSHNFFSTTVHSQKYILHHDSTCTNTHTHSQKYTETPGSQGLVGITTNICDHYSLSHALSSHCSLKEKFKPFGEKPA